MMMMAREDVWLPFQLTEHVKDGQSMQCVCGQEKASEVWMSSGWCQLVDAVMVRNFQNLFSLNKLLSSYHARGIKLPFIL